MIRVTKKHFLMQCETYAKDMPVGASNNPAVSLNLKIAALFSGTYALNSQTVAAVIVNFYPLMSIAFGFPPFPMTTLPNSLLW